jgi:CRP/FNR family transcriptional regulator, nitrogen fixation regulation protein
MPQDVPVRVPPRVAVPPGQAADRALGGVTKPGRSYRPNAEIFADGKPAENLYCVVTGSVRTFKIFSDGRRQISGFYLPGDVFGLEFADTYSCSAEAITDTRLRVISRSTLAVRADREPAIAGELLALTAHELKRAQERALLLAKTAQERVASFLVEMAERGAGGNAIDLPMSRQDIADYLGMSVETVSRTLVSLEKNSTIRVWTRRIVLRDRSALESVSSPH